MKKQLSAIAIALSTLTASTVVQASEETYVPASHSTLTRAQVQAEQATSSSLSQDMEETYVPASDSTLTRVQVQADLAAWHDAGLSYEWRGNQTPDVDSVRYRSKMAVYRQRVAQQKSSSGVATQ